MFSPVQFFFFFTISETDISIKFLCQQFVFLRATLDMNLRHIHLEKKNQHDTHSRKCREKERDTRNLKKAELQLKVAEEGLNHTRTVYDKLKAQVGALAGCIVDKVASGSGCVMGEVG